MNNHNNEAANDATNRHVLLPSFRGIVYLNSDTNGNKNNSVANVQHLLLLDGGGDISFNS